MTQKKQKPELLPLPFVQLFNAIADGKSALINASFEALSDADKVRAADILKFKKAAFERAKELGPEVWKNWDFAKDVFRWSPNEPTDAVLAALSHPKGPTLAIDRRLLRRVAHYTLLVSFRAMELAPADLDKILKHELLHMGYPHHNADFRKVCREVGGVIADASVTGGVEENFFEQRQPNGRYKRASPSFATEEEALAWFNSQEQKDARLAQAKAWLDANPGMGRSDVMKALNWRMAMS